MFCHYSAYVIQSVFLICAYDYLSASVSSFVGCHLVLLIMLFRVPLRFFNSVWEDEDDLDAFWDSPVDFRSESADFWDAFDSSSDLTLEGPVYMFLGVDAALGVGGDSDGAFEHSFQSTNTVPHGAFSAVPHSSGKLILYSFLSSFF